MMYIHITYCTNEGTNEPTKHDIIYEDNDMITLRVYLFVRSSEKQINKSEAGAGAHHQNENIEQPHRKYKESRVNRPPSVTHSRLILWKTIVALAFKDFVKKLRMARRYDSHTTTFSPEGRLYQVGLVIVRVLSFVSAILQLTPFGRSHRAYPE